MNKQCPSNKILNPKTNRCVKRSGVIGRRLLVKKCSDDQILNPQTGRCVKRSGVIGRRLLGVSPKTPKRKRKLTIVPLDKTDKVLPPPVLKFTKIPDSVKKSKLKLKEYQIKIVQYMEHNESVGVFHGTGSGKTLTSITVAQSFLTKYPGDVIFIGSPSIFENFKKEIKAYGVPKNMIKRYKLYTFDKFASEIEANKTICNNNMLIIDEVHNLRNRSTKPKGEDVKEAMRYAAAMNCAMKSKKRVLLSATPFSNDYDDLAAIINLIHGNRIFAWGRKDRTAVPPLLFKNKDAEKNIKFYLADRIDYMPTPKNSDYPAVREKFVHVEMTKAFSRRYMKAIEDSDQFGGNPQTFYHGYRRAVNSLGAGYYSQKLNYVDRIIGTGKTIIYTNWLEYGKSPIKDIMEKRKFRYQVIDGSLSSKKRGEIVTKYNKDELDVLIITKAAAEGIDLKRTVNMIILDPVWNPAQLKQVMGRAVRYKSHHDLPKEKQLVNIYKIVLNFPGFGDKEQNNKWGGTHEYVKNASELVHNFNKGEFSETADTLLYDICALKQKKDTNVTNMLSDISISADTYV